MKKSYNEGKTPNALETLVLCEAFKVGFYSKDLLGDKSGLQ